MEKHLTPIFDANDASSGTTVLVQLSTNKTGNTNLPGSFTTTLGELGVDLAPSAAPLFPQAEIDRINSDRYLSTTDKAVRLKAELDKFAAAQQGYAQGGNVALEDRIITGLINFLVNNYGVSRSNVKVNDFQTSKFKTANGETVYSVTATATWGN